MARSSLLCTYNYQDVSKIGFYIELSTPNLSLKNLCNFLFETLFFFWYGKAYCVWGKMWEKSSIKVLMKCKNHRIFKTILTFKMTSFSYIDLHMSGAFYTLKYFIQSNCQSSYRFMSTNLWRAVWHKWMNQRSLTLFIYLRVSVSNLGMLWNDIWPEVNGRVQGGCARADSATWSAEAIDVNPLPIHISFRRNAHKWYYSKMMEM